MTDDDEIDLSEKVAWTAKFGPRERERLAQYHNERDILTEESERDEKTYSSTIRALVLTGLRVEENDIDLDRLTEQRKEMEAEIEELEAELTELESLKTNPSVIDWLDVTFRSPLPIRSMFFGAFITVASLFILSVAFALEGMVEIPEFILRGLLFTLVVGLFFTFIAPPFVSVFDKVKEKLQ